MIKTTHATAGFVLSLFIAAHLLHHFVGLVPKQISNDTSWHMEVQKKYMPRGAIEILLVFIPLVVTWLSGAYLVVKAGSFSVFFRSCRTLLLGTDSRQAVELQQRQKLRAVQLASSCIFGTFLFTHSCAVMFLRYVRHGDPINVEGAAHALHDPAFPPFARGIAFLYYVMLIASCVAHIVSSIAFSQVRDLRVGAPGVAASVNSWWSVVVTTSLMAFCLALLTVWELKAKTSAESTAKHWPL